MAMLEARPYRPFKSSEEYLEAMKEDLAEWLSTLYPELSINAENFMDRLDTGVALCKVGECFFKCNSLHTFHFSDALDGKVLRASEMALMAKRLPCLFLPFFI